MSYIKDGYGQENRSKAKKRIFAFIIIVLLVVACFYFKIPSLIKEKLTKGADTAVYKSGEDSVTVYHI